MALHHLLQAGGVDVLAVGDLVTAVCVDESSEHFGVSSGVVVGRETAVVEIVELSHPSSLPHRRCEHCRYRRLWLVGLALRRAF